MTAPPLLVANNTERSRYEGTLGAEVVAFADYALRGTIVVMSHTVTLPKHRGRGFAGMVVRRALDDIDRAGHKVVPSCWYVARFIDEHPEFSHLVSS